MSKEYQWHPYSCKNNVPTVVDESQKQQWERDDTCRTDPSSTIIPFPQPDFSERFTSGPRFGWEGIPRPSEFFRRLQGFTGDSEFDLDPALDATPLSGAAEELPSVLEGIVNDVTSVVHRSESVPSSVADAIEWVLADVAMLGILAEATWRTQHEEDSEDLRRTYIQHITTVFSELGLDDPTDVDLENLQTAFNVGTRVLNEIFQFEICPQRPSFDTKIKTKSRAEVKAEAKAQQITPSCVTMPNTTTQEGSNE